MEITREEHDRLYNRVTVLFSRITLRPATPGRERSIRNAVQALEGLLDSLQGHPILRENMHEYIVQPRKNVSFRNEIEFYIEEGYRRLNGL